MGAPGAAAAAAAAGTIAASNADEPRDSFEHVAKGSMLLKRMGWKEGQGLGRRSDGQLRPLQVNIMYFICFNCVCVGIKDEFSFFRGSESRGSFFHYRQLMLYQMS